MTLFDDEPVKKPSQHVVGCDLSLLSVDELNERIQQLKGEITRLEAEREKKSSGKQAAEALFKF